MIILRKLSLHFIFSLTVLLAVQQGYAQLRSFPGAEGAGSFTSGGRGTSLIPTTVFEVTNLTDVNSPGSLRYALGAAATYRTIIFRVSGTIHLTSKLTIRANTTLAGQTAPGDGICLADHPVVISGDNVIVRYMRFRLGDKNQLKTSPANCGVPVAPFTPACMPVDGSGGDDAFGNLGNKNIIIDHCSISWSADEALTIYRGDSVSVQWNIISEPLNYSYHFETGDTDFEHHGYGGIWGARHGSFHHNLFAHSKSRNPRFAGNSTYDAGVVESADFRNNVLYNWGLYTVYGGDGGEYNLVNNYYKSGPSTGSSTKYRIVNVDSSTSFPFAKYYLSGNHVDGSVANTNNNWSGAHMLGGNAADTVKSKVYSPFLSTYLPSVTHTALQAYDTVLKAAGAILPRRDTLDSRIVADVTLKRGRLIDVQGGYPHGTAYSQTVNAWPTLNSDVAPPDTDHDGMPDSWETANSLDPNNANDRGNTAANGYTNLENYLNSITSTTTPITVNPASATWTLFSDQTPSLIGSATASNQSLGSYLAGIQYGSTFGGIGGWQRVGSTSYLPVGYNANSYVEYNVKPAAGKDFTCSSVEFGALGGGTGTARMAIYYSLDGFVTSQPLGTCTYNGTTYDATVSGTPVVLLNTSTPSLTGQQIASIPVSIAVTSAQTLSIRIYVWITGTGNRYFTSQNVKVQGVTTDGVLPLQLIQFSLQPRENENKLTWTTVNESDMASYEIERSTDGQQFISIGKTLALNGNNNTYSFVDSKPAVDISYYRLKMISRSGTYNYSYKVTARNRRGGKLTVYPNPVSDVLTLEHSPAQEQQQVQICSADGKVIREWSIDRFSTQNTFNIDFLKAGIYLLNYYDGRQKQTLKLVKL